MESVTETVINVVPFPVVERDYYNEKELGRLACTPHEKLGRAKRYPRAIWEPFGTPNYHHRGFAPFPTQLLWAAKEAVGRKLPASLRRFPPGNARFLLPLRCAHQLARHSSACRDKHLPASLKQDERGAGLQDVKRASPQNGRNS